MLARTLARTGLTSVPRRPFPRRRPGDAPHPSYSPTSRCPGSANRRPTPAVLGTFPKFRRSAPATRVRTPPCPSAAAVRRTRSARPSREVAPLLSCAVHRDFRLPSRLGPVRPSLPYRGGADLREDGVDPPRPRSPSRPPGRRTPAGGTGRCLRAGLSYCVPSLGKPSLGPNLNFQRPLELTRCFSV